MRNSLIRIALYYLEMAALFMLLAMSPNAKKLETIQKVLEEDEKRNNCKRFEDFR
ncbi:MAG: hypothetical protein MJ052_02635 [Sphaerochaetaceae bacterium]|nr:hypothetical protein [Sphaerochaetaceae bacterium]